MYRGHLSEVELTEYADGELAADLLGAAESHLDGCRACAAAVAKMRQSASLVARVRDCAAPSAIRRRAVAVLSDSVLSISCKRALFMMHEMIDHRLSLLSSVPLQLHLRECKRCEEELAALSSAARAVRALPSIETPAKVRDQVLAAYRQQTRRAGSAPRWRPAVAAAFAVLVMGAASLLRPQVAPDHSAVTAPILSGTVKTSPAPVDVAAAPAPPATDVERPAPAEHQPEAADIASRPAPPRRIAARPALPVAKGPAPEITARMVAGAPQLRLPSALRALRTVAQCASSDWDVQLAMERAGERFQTLDSEAVAQRRVAALPATSTEGADAGGKDQPANTSPVPPREPGSAKDSGREQPVRSSPTVGGASVLTATSLI
ncbi:MAG: hypothetical protein ACE149_12700 [Armatimonadota bacterium]